MIDIHGLADQLRNYNQTNGTRHYIRLNPDTSCSLCQDQEGYCPPGTPSERTVIQEFGNPYQLMQYLSERTGIRK